MPRRAILLQPVRQGKKRPRLPLALPIVSVAIVRLATSAQTAAPQAGRLAQWMEQGAPQRRGQPVAMAALRAMGVFMTPVAASAVVRNAIRLGSITRSPMQHARPRSAPRARELSRSLGRARAWSVRTVDRSSRMARRTTLTLLRRASASLTGYVHRGRRRCSLLQPSEIVDVRHMVGAVHMESSNLSRVALRMTTAGVVTMATSSTKSIAWRGVGAVHMVRWWSLSRVALMTITAAAVRVATSLMPRRAILFQPVRQGKKRSRLPLALPIVSVAIVRLATSAQTAAPRAGRLAQWMEQGAPRQQGQPVAIAVARATGASLVAASAAARHAAQ
jgi:hypothetical protein